MFNPFNKKLVGFSLLSLTLVFHLSSAPLMAGGSDDESDEDELVIVGGPFDIPQSVIQQVITQHPKEDEKTLIAIAVSILPGKSMSSIKMSVRKALKRRERQAGQVEPTKHKAVAAEGARHFSQAPHTIKYASKDASPIKRKAPYGNEEDEAHSDGPTAMKKPSSLPESAMKTLPKPVQDQIRELCKEFILKNEYASVPGDAVGNTKKRDVYWSARKAFIEKIAYDFHLSREEIPRLIGAQAKKLTDEKSRKRWTKESQ